MTMQTLQGLGWQWRQNGVVLCVQIDGKKQSVFVPLNRVWHDFHTELAAVGCPLQASVGEEITVGGLFSGIAHAVSSAAHAVTHNAITKAASKVASTATSYAEHAIGKLPVVGPLANTVAHLASIPVGVVDQLAQGGRIDRVALGSLKSALKDVKAVAPYATTVLSLVPGVGTGLSGAIGAGLALASGQNITQALEAGVRGALPGGELAAKAFDVASAAMQGKPIDQVALAALPITPAARQALQSGIQVARDLASGKKVSQALVDAATHQLPANLQKAVQIGAALGHAKNLQGAVGALSQAVSLSTNLKSGAAAAAALKTLPRGVAPSALLQAVHLGNAAQATIAAAHKNAALGHGPSATLIGALKFHAAVPAGKTNAAKGGAHMFRPRYHTTPAATPSAPSVGAPFGHYTAHALATRANHHNHPATHPIGARFEVLAAVHTHYFNGQKISCPPGVNSVCVPAVGAPIRSFMAPRARIFAPIAQPHHRHHHHAR